MKHNNLFSILVFILFLWSCSQPVKKESTASEKIQSILNVITEPQIPDYSINLLSFTTDTTYGYHQTFQKAINILKTHKGGTLIVPAGTYFVNGPIHFISNMNLHLDKGAILKFSSEPSDYLPVVRTSWEGTFLYNYSPFIYGCQLENVCITGEGTIDGEASETWNKWKQKQGVDQALSREMNHNSTPVDERVFGEGHYLRPQLIQFFDCKNMLIENVKIEDSPFWCIHLLRSENVIVRGVRYDAQNYNNDGIDPEYSRNVLIEDVVFNNSDDNVAIKAGRDTEGRASEVRSENIIVRNCKFKGLHALVIGSEMSAGVQNVFVQNCTFAGDLKRGIYLKSNPDRGGFIRNVYCENIDFGKTEDCFYITSFYHNEGEGHATDISDIHFSNITCRQATNNGIVIQGYSEKKVHDITFTNIRIDSVKNAISFTNTEDIVFNDMIIGKEAGAPSAAQ